MGKIRLNHKFNLNDLRQKVWKLAKLLTKDKIIATRLATITSQMTRLLIDSGLKPYLNFQLHPNIHPPVLSITFTTENQISVPSLISSFFDRVNLLRSENKYYQIKADYWLSNNGLLTEGLIREAQAIFEQKSREQLMTELEEKNQALQESLWNLKRMGAELDVARQLQQMVLPKPEELEAIEGVDIAGYMTPADEVGGDYSNPI